MSVVRLHDAMNEHDQEAFSACFHEDYKSEQPVHPGRGFGGREQVRANWSAIFSRVPDFRERSQELTAQPARRPSGGRSLSTMDVPEQTPSRVMAAESSIRP